MNRDLLDSCQFSVRLKAPAKLNLGLSVVGRRSDGYHLLESLFWPIDLVDDLLIGPSSNFSVIAQWSSDAALPTGLLPEPGENLVFRAARALCGPRLPPIAIQIKKRIPLGGGLGGGSSNAGTFLRYLVSNHEVANPIAPEGIARIAAQIGADVPFFLSPSPTWVTGIGDRRMPLDVPSVVRKGIFFLVVVFPFPTLTSEVFREFRGTGKTFSVSRPRPRLTTITEMATYLREASNDLESLVTKRNPRIASVVDALRRTSPIHASLSGSGSSCFAVYLREEERRKSLKELLPFFRESHCKGFEAQTYVDNQVETT